MKDKKLKVEIQRNYLRRLFLERVSKVPELIPSLKAGVGRSTVDQRQFLSAWSQSWHLDAAWVRDSADNLLQTWPERKSYRTKQAYLDSLVLTYVPSLPNVIFGPPTLPLYYSTLSHLTRQDLAEAGKGVRRNYVKAARRNYLKEARRVAETYCKEVEAALRLAAFKDNPQRDIDWTVRSKVQKEKYSDIAKADRLRVISTYDRHAPAKRVREAVRRTLRILDFEPVTKAIPTKLADYPNTCSWCGASAPYVVSNIESTVSACAGHANAAYQAGFEISNCEPVKT